MSWDAALLALLVSHLAGDLLLQTEWQAVNKGRGLGDPVARRALVLHVFTYTLACVPALAWIGANTSVARAVGVAAAIALPHLLIDDGRLVRAWLRDVKRVPGAAPGLSIAVDQSFHVVCLLGAAVLAAS